MRRIRIFTAFFVGYIAFFLLYAFLTWVFTLLNITPYGRFVAAFFKGRKPEEARAYIEANKELFSMMLPRAVWFSNVFITPSVGFVLGLVIGLIATQKENQAPSASLIWAFLSALPISIFFWVKSGADPNSAVYLALFLFVTGAGGLTGNRIAKKMLYKENQGL